MESNEHSRWIEVVERLARIETYNETQLRRITEVESKVEQLERSVSRYRGWVGGVVFVATGLIAFIKLVGVNLAAFLAR